MKKGFSLLELFIVIALSGAMAIFVFSYLDPTAMTKENIKTQLQSQINTITSAIFQCKELSNIFPLQEDANYADATLLNTLECNTTVPYLLDGDKGHFIPPPPTGFTNYKATQSGTIFYITTTAQRDSLNDEVLQELNSSYSTKQYVLDYNTTVATMKFYLSR